MNLKSNKAITLIALVITIIILIILAGVSISIVFDEEGLINKAKKAAEDMEIAQKEEERQIEYAEALMNGIKNIKQVKEEGYVEKLTIVEDTSKNKFVLPKGFKIAEDSGLNVTEGIVIEDNDIIEGIGNNRGNQYVWIPVGDNIKKADGTEVDITLGRYVFADGTNHKDEEGNTLKIGTPILKQSAEDYEDEIGINIREIDPTYATNYEFKELKIARTGISSKGLDGLNTTALNLKGFIESVKTNGGYYIARYEASYGVDKKSNSKVSNLYIDSTTPPTTREEGMLWNHITQIDATVASRKLYETATTDLINSYAWDTALIYIQEFSGDLDYSKQNGKSINSSLTNTGVNNDEQCKINDMASNELEWTTEYTTYTNDTQAAPCTVRGGAYYETKLYPGIHNVYNATDSISKITFRTILYI